MDVDHRQFAVLNSDSDDEEDLYDEKNLQDGTLDLGFLDATSSVVALTPEMIMMKILVAILIVIVLLIKMRRQSMIRS